MTEQAKGEKKAPKIKKGRGRYNKPSRAARRQRCGGIRKKRFKAPMPRGVQVNKGTAANIIIPVPSNGW